MRKGKPPAKDDGKIFRERCLTVQTCSSLRITLHSMKALTNDLLNKHGFNYVLTRKMNQDCLEVSFI